MNLLKKIEQKKRKQRRAENGKKVALGTVIAAVGAIAGGAAGVLLAPKAGKETREDIKEKSNVAKEKINESVKNTKGKVSESKAKIKEYLENRKSSEAAETVETEEAVQEAEENIEE